MLVFLVSNGEPARAAHRTLTPLGHFGTHAWRLGIPWKSKPDIPLRNEGRMCSASTTIVGRHESASLASQKMKQSKRRHKLAPSLPSVDIGRNFSPHRRICPCREERNLSPLQKKECQAAGICAVTVPAHTTHHQVDPGLPSRPRTARGSRLSQMQYVWYRFSLGGKPS